MSLVEHFSPCVGLQKRPFLRCLMLRGGRDQYLRSATGPVVGNSWRFTIFLVERVCLIIANINTTSDTCFQIENTSNSRTIRENPIFLFVTVWCRLTLPSPFFRGPVMSMFCSVDLFRPFLTISLKSCTKHKCIVMKYEHTFRC